jgi:hypothetical protein
MASSTRGAAAAASEAITAAKAEYGTLDQLFELVAKARVLDVVLPRQRPDPAARLNLEAEGESAIGSRLGGTDDLAPCPGRVAALRGVRLALRQAQLRLVESEIESAGRGSGCRGALKRSSARRQVLGRHTDGASGSSDLRQREHKQDAATELTHRAQKLPAPVRPDIGSPEVKRNGTPSVKGRLFGALPGTTGSERIDSDGA